MLKRIVLFAISGIIGVAYSPAQPIALKGAFLAGEVKVGEPVLYSLSVQYDKYSNILMPDSLADYSPFEYLGRTYFPTRSDSLSSYDSVVYKLATYEIDPVQYLQLPVYVLTDGKKAVYYPKVDSVALIELIPELPDQPEVVSNTSYVKIKRQFNYPYFIIGTGVLFFAMLVIALFFGRKITKMWKLYMLRRAHKRFVHRFFHMMRDVTSNNPVNSPEHVLAEWKLYLERLERKPVSKLTTKEILVLHPDDKLKENLKALDRMIFGGERGSDLFACFDALLKFSIGIFEEKMKALKNN